MWLTRLCFIFHQLLVKELKLPPLVLHGFFSFLFVFFFGLGNKNKNKKTDPDRTPELEIAFSDMGWVSTNPLTAENVMEYFSMSGFYDRQTASVEILKMQRRAPTAELLRQTKGFEFAVEFADPPRLFVIRKDQRTSETTVVTRGYFYVLDGTIYAAPPLHLVATAALRRAFAVLGAALQDMCDFVRFDPVTGNSWDAGGTKPAAGSEDSAFVTPQRPPPLPTPQRSLPPQVLEARVSKVIKQIETEFGTL